jgi:hypothetical protein
VRLLDKKASFRSVDATLLLSHIRDALPAVPKFESCMFGDWASLDREGIFIAVLMHGSVDKSKLALYADEQCQMIVPLAQSCKSTAIALRSPKTLILYCGSWPSWQ